MTSSAADFTDDDPSGFGDLVLSFEADEGVYGQVQEEISFVEELPPVTIEEKSYVQLSQYKCCRIISHGLKLDDDNIFNSAIKLFSTVNVNNKPDCIINEINSSLQTLFYMINEDMLSDAHKLKIADVYLKSRHEILFKMSMLAIGQSPETSDFSFNEVLGLYSKRTPDYLCKLDNKVLIYEFTVVTDVERGKMMKGYKGLGMKYQTEADELKLLGFDVHYHNVIVDSKDANNTIHAGDLQLVNKFFNDDDAILVNFDIVRKHFCMVTNRISSFMSGYFSRLFTDDLKIDANFGTFGKYICKRPALRSYQNIAAPISLYNKIVTGWPRFGYMLDKFADKNRKVKQLNEKLIIINHDLNRGRFNFNFGNGVTLTEWDDIINTHDRFRFMKNLTSDSELGKVTDVEFFSISNVKPVTTRSTHVFLVDQHPSSTSFYNDENVDLSRYKKLCDETLDKSLGTVFDDDNYDEKILSSLKDMDLTKFVKLPFSLNVLTTQSFELATTSFSQSMQEKNMPLDIPLRRYQKPSFLYPLISANNVRYGPVTQKNVTLLNQLNTHLTGFTRFIINKALEQNYVFGTTAKESPEEIKIIDKKVSDLNKLQSTIWYKNIDRTTGKKIVRDLTLIEGYKENKEELRSLGKLRRKECERLKYFPKTVNFIRTKVKKKTELGKLFQEEMSHFRDKDRKSILMGVGLHVEDLHIEYSKLKSELLLPVTYQSQDKFMVTDVGPDCKLLKNLKESYIETVLPQYNKILSTSLYHASCFVSRFCYTLFYHSQTSMGSDSVIVDNLGYENVLLIVKGGKKIFATKKSKLYRLIYPINDAITPWFCHPSYDKSFQTFIFEQTTYLITPWQNMDEVLIQDGISFNHKIGGYLLMQSIDNDPIDIINKLFVNIMMAFHARRQTESFMHNMRYICMNSMSISSKIVDMLPELAGFNYDLFQCFLRQQIVKNFKPFAQGLNDFSKNLGDNNPHDYFKSHPIQHIYDKDVVIDDLNMLSVFVYSTFLMPKAPVNQKIEQFGNLRQVLDIHKEFHDCLKNNSMENFFTTLDEKKNFHDHWNSLFENDFKLDPKLCSRIGQFARDYLSKKTNVDELNSHWVKILSKSWDTMSNSSGLRGAENTIEFFGNKGYYIVYKKAIKDKKSMNDLVKILMSTENLKNAYVNLQDFNKSFAAELNMSTLDQLVFHIVDKRQRGGSREIYVMDLMTKLNQQPLEEFFGHLCSLVPNEMISVPSNKRLFQIHTQVFERPTFDHDKTYNLVLDCRKWAPKSMLMKYNIFVNALSPILPNSFTKLFYRFFSLMETKKVYTRAAIFDMLKKDEKTSDLAKYMHLSLDEKGAYFVMPYSFVMGIFNYLSSLFHVFNQLYASYMINRHYQQLNCNVYYHMHAHSDDSAGKVMCDSEDAMVESFIIYEYLLKGCNHLLSEKKSCISNIYYEFISILYVKNEQLGLLIKYAGAFNLLPTDSGYCQDVKSCYSKVMELFSNGATFQQCYIALKILSSLYHRFYYNRYYTRNMLSLIPHLGGIPDPHPIMVIIGGSDSDLLRLYKTEPSFNKQLLLSRSILGGDLFDDSFAPSLTCQPQIYMSDKYKKLGKLLPDIEDDLKWLLNNANLNNTGCNALSFLLKLENKNFIAGLQDETLTRRISRAYFYSSHMCLRTPNNKLTSFKSWMTFLEAYLFGSDILNDDLKTMINNFLTEESGNITKLHNSLEIVHYESIALMDIFDKQSFKLTDLTPHAKTCKPIHINIMKVTSPMITDYDPIDLTIYITKPNYRWLLKHSAKLELQYKSLLEQFRFKNIDMKEMSAEMLYKFLNRYKSRFLKELHVFSNMPPGQRDINNYKDVLSLLAHNSFNNSYIKGLTLPFGRSLTLPINHLLTDIFGDEFKMTISLLNLYLSLCTSKTYSSGLCKMKYNQLPWLDAYTDLNGLINSLINYWEKLPIYEPFLTVHLRIIKALNEHTSNPAHMLEMSYFHSFIKRQIFVNNLWLGKGLLYINLPNCPLLFTINNMKLISCASNITEHSLTPIDVTYINYTLINAGLGDLSSHLIPAKYNKANESNLGLTKNGEYKLTKVNELVNVIPDFYLQTPLDSLFSKLHVCILKPLKQFQYLLQYDDISLGLDTRKILFFDIELIEQYNNIKLLIDNDHNSSLKSENDEFSDWVTQIASEATDTELKVSETAIIEHFDLTKMYDIIYFLDRSEEINFKSIRPRIRLFPGQEGGLLDALVKYKQSNLNFDFNFSKVFGPEYMVLKSHQPSAYMSELFSNIKAKFNAVYTDEDKTLITLQLKKLSEIVHVEDYTEKLFSLLTTWGYVGVMGSIQQLENEKNYEFFKSITMTENARLSKNFSDYFIFFIKQLNELFKSPEFHYLNYQDSESITNHAEFKIYITNILCINSYSLCIDPKIKLTNMFYNMGIRDLSNLINAVFESESCLELLSSKFSRHSLFSFMPISKEFTKEWKEALNMCFFHYLKNRRYDGDVNVHKMLHLTDKVTSTTWLINACTELDVKIGVKRPYHMGFISHDMYTKLNKRSTVMINNKLISCKSTVIKDPKCESVILNSKALMLRPITEDWYDECYQDIETELNSTEPDYDELNTYINSDTFEEGYNRGFNAVFEGKRKVCYSYDLKVFLNPFSTANNSLSKMRQLGETLMMICTNIPFQLLTFNQHIAFFNFKKAPYLNRSIVNPNCLIVIIIDSRPIVKRHWEELYDLCSLSIETYTSEYLDSMIWSWRDSNGFLVDRSFLITNNISSDVQYYEKLLYLKHRPQPELEPEIAIVEDSIMKKVEELKVAYNLSDHFFNRYQNLLELWSHNSVAEYKLSLLQSSLNNLQELGKDILKVKKHTETLLSKPKTVQQNINITQVPSIFGVYKELGLSKSKALKDRKLLAELNAISPTMIGNLVSGTLMINEQMFITVRKQIRMAKNSLNNRSKDYEGKLFWLNVITMILNDSCIATDSKNDLEWLQLNSQITNFIVDDDDEDIEVDILERSPGRGGLKYFSSLE